MVLVIVAGATVFGHFLQITNVPTELATWMANLPLPGWGLCWWSSALSAGRRVS